LFIDYLGLTVLSLFIDYLGLTVLSLFIDYLICLYLLFPISLVHYHCDNL